MNSADMRPTSRSPRASGSQSDLHPSAIRFKVSGLHIGPTTPWECYFQGSVYVGIS